MQHEHDECERAAMQAREDYQRHVKEMKSFTLEAIGYPDKRPVWQWDGETFTMRRPDECQPNGIHLLDIAEVATHLQRSVDALLAEYGLWLSGNHGFQTAGDEVANAKRIVPDLYDIHGRFVQKLS